MWFYTRYLWAQKTKWRSELADRDLGRTMLDLIVLRIFLFFFFLTYSEFCQQLLDM